MEPNRRHNITFLMRIFLFRLNLESTKHPLRCGLSKYINFSPPVTFRQRNNFDVKKRHTHTCSSFLQYYFPLVYPEHNDRSLGFCPWPSLDCRLINLHALCKITCKLSWVFIQELLQLTLLVSYSTFRSVFNHLSQSHFFWTFWIIS